MILGITGGTGCGKTTLLKEIEALGGLVLDCDAIYHRLLREDKVLLSSIQAAFPGAFRDGSLDRKALGAFVFGDPAALHQLNGITHKAIEEEVLRLLKTKPSLAAIDAIALFEGGLSDLCDLTIAVTAPEEARVKRLMARDCISEAYARSRISAQHGEDWFKSRCDFTLRNDGSPEEFQRKCLAFLVSADIMKEKSKGDT